MPSLSGSNDRHACLLIHIEYVVITYFNKLTKNHNHFLILSQFVEVSDYDMKISIVTQKARGLSELLELDMWTG